MKKNAQLIYNTLFTLVLICLPIISLLAQTGSDPGGFSEPGETLDTPIDGGLSLLIAAGVGYGVKKVRDERKKNREGRELNEK